MRDLVLPANLPPTANAKLPVVYESAKQALTECDRLDECKDWANKAEAMASYARQAGDKSLFQMATRIQARAIRRCGELLQAITPAKNHHDANTRSTSVGSGSSRTAAAKDAGLSERQKHTALRVASVPKEEFDAIVESDTPPTVTEIAERGTKKKPPPLVDLEGIDPKEFAAATEGQGLLRQLSDYCKKVPAAVAYRGLYKHERVQVLGSAETVKEWIEQLINLTNLSEATN